MSDVNIDVVPLVGGDVLEGADLDMVRLAQFPVCDVHLERICCYFLMCVNLQKT